MFSTEFGQLVEALKSQPVNPELTTKQQLVYDSFMMGVNWTLNAIIQCGDVFDMSAKDADLFRQRAQKIIRTSKDLNS